MAKAKRLYGCTECGATFPKWAGQCGDCGVWNTLTETMIEANSAAPSSRAGWAGEQAQVKTLAEVSVEEIPRFSTSSTELDRVLGGGGKRIDRVREELILVLDLSVRDIQVRLSY